MKLTAVIEKSSNKFYSIYTENNDLEWGFGGYGESVAIAKEDYRICIDEMRELAREEGKPFPDEIKVEFRYDIPSFFNYFDWINISAFAKKAGINESKMRAYKAGLATASERTLAKIQATIKEMCEAMAAAVL
ncbi:MAG: glycoside hydrolase family 18 protein [Muribaculaceae bacterium]|nr:glycoside hydrolase family 18 protein [Muribaculaceae bacterium]